jgi:integrase
VFASEIGRPLDRRSVTAQTFKLLIKRAGLPAKTRFHDLRHTCAPLVLAITEEEISLSPFASRHLLAAACPIARRKCHLPHSLLGPSHPQWCQEHPTRTLQYVSILRIWLTYGESEGVTDGARTRDLRSHNPMLCQLSYGHQAHRRF